MTPSTTDASTTNGTIRDLDSFNQVTGNPRQIAGVYFYWLLDPLIDVAHGIAKAFFSCPQYFTALGDAHVVEDLARLAARYGADERVPSREQRAVVYGALFGGPGTPADGQPGFEQAREEVAQAATAFAQRAVDTGLGQLRDDIRRKVRKLKDFLDTLRGDSVNWSAEQALPAVTEGLAYQILRNRGVAAVFNGIPAPAATWPYAPDANGDKLVEAACQQLAWDGQASWGAAGHRLTRQGFSDLQQAAITGAEAIGGLWTSPAPSRTRNSTR